MQTVKQWNTSPNSRHKKGWMTKNASSKTYEKGWITESSRSKVYQMDWTNNKTAPGQVQQYDKQPAILGKTSEALTVNCQLLSPCLVDALAQNNLDWISSLSSNWKTNLSAFSLQSDSDNWNAIPLMVDSWVQSASQSDYYLAVLNNERYWISTHCPYSSELGRARFVVCYQDSMESSSYIAFVTNRLDWSPSNIITQYLQTYTWRELLEDNLR